jgi:hypothetical protein
MDPDRRLDESRESINKMSDGWRDGARLRLRVEFHGKLRIKSARCSLHRLLRLIRSAA